MTVVDGGGVEIDKADYAARNVQQELRQQYEISRQTTMEHCKKAMEQQHVIPFLMELKRYFGEEQFLFAPQIAIHDHKPVGVSFKIGDGSATSISTGFGNIAVTRFGDTGSFKGVPFVYPPGAEPSISNSGDLTRDNLLNSLADE